MIVWGLVSAATIFVNSPASFYAMRFLLGLAEAGFFPGAILYLTYWFPRAQRARKTAAFMTAVAVSGIIGGPISGWILGRMAGVSGLAGWQWLFVLEGLPSVLLGLWVLLKLLGAALATVLGTLRQELPALAHADPGPAFTAAVVAATRTLRPRRAARGLELWQQLVGRPRLAWEFATAACFVLMMLCALPFSPFRPLPQQALAVIRVDAVTVLQSVATQVGPVVQSATARVWAASGGRLESAVAARQRTFAREHAETAAAWSALRADLTEAGAGIRSLNVARLSHALLALGAGLRRLFGADAAGQPATPEIEGGSP